MKHEINRGREGIEEVNGLLKVGIIGLGDVSLVHRHAIKTSQYGKIVAVCDRNPNLREDWMEFPFFTDVETMLQEMKLDVVHICLPHYLHYFMTKLCIQYDVHVLLEKPVAISFQEALEQNKLALSTDKKICVCFQNRYNKSFITLKERLEKEEVGKIKSVKGLVTWFRPETYYTSKPWRGMKKEAGYGSIINQSIHTLDLIQLLGGSISSCKASLSNLTDYDIEVEDTASATFIFESGVKAFFHATNAYTENSSVELQVVTEKEKFTIKDNKLYLTKLDGDKELIAEDDFVPGTKSYYGNGHVRLINSFYDSIINQNDDYITVKDALPSMEMIEMMDRSSQNAQQPKRITREDVLNETVS
ncbi:Gfo/Idh/MocA family oxidoreductase [Jeotgalibaca sp. MA1X17-3]|uniref:Gfo/Idh/MocA family protein n=1 Tax=Jeotgalibaca sp. MA1X17-3 TaxID=2908211 RepID=UPI001F19CCAA|nr:Gfo/Idh/MocA family oxidoreductase [Jeotgalibaca sp. MA1X17-3]UJF16178.1 Gfo/Idh/MocA family oxidoreductase [Jeotgalibaca sp. MA1X17-3]